MNDTEMAITIGVITVALIGGAFLIRILYRFKKSWDKSKYWLGK
jgi:ABC-type enterobactin transport system permease subunit